MRIISGQWKGKRLFSVKGLNLRPTSDRVKEAIFDILQDHIAGQQVLDLFAGTGALGIEALSRGAKRAVFVEESAHSLTALRKNIEECKIKDQAQVLAREVMAGIKILEAKGESFQLIFLDPPYGKGLAHKTLKILAKSSIVSSDTLIIAEHAPTNDIFSIPHLQRVDTRKYGGTLVSFFQLQKEPTEFNSIV
ncbi:MAG: 16S rRNA (guanine(966)-N(2))-methyltransferase RsmD [Proteobacteria bacterium]|nr:16S rRNA (guanine(966)-N(2))-methyltransferase RsmD [Pseudomonadota bacterium]